MGSKLSKSINDSYKHCSGMQFDKDTLKKVTGLDNISSKNGDSFVFHLDSNNLFIWISITDPLFLEKTLWDGLSKKDYL